MFFFVLKQQNKTRFFKKKQHCYFSVFYPVVINTLGLLLLSSSHFSLPHFLEYKPPASISTVRCQMTPYYRYITNYVALMTLYVKLSM